MLVSVAIPVRDGGDLLEEVLGALASQQLNAGDELEVVVCDSGSRDRSVAIARAAGAAVVQIAPQRFSHGATRNLLMERSTGEVVAFLTQDSVPADQRWLVHLLEGCRTAPDVGLAYGPYLPRPDASPMVRRELQGWFASLEEGTALRVDRLDPQERSLPAAALFGPRGYFTDANGCVVRAAWREVPFRPVAYAEDHLLAHDMLRAGYAKVFVPAAAVVHSHDYRLVEWLRRSFDETRAVSGIYGMPQLGDLRRVGRWVWGSVGADWREERRRGGYLAGARLLPRATAHHAARGLGTALGARSEQLPAALRRRLSLERRD